MFQKLLVAVDGSESARTATRLAGRLGRSLTLVCAVRPSPITAGSALDASISAVTGAGAAFSQQVALAEERQASAWLEEAKALLPEGIAVATRAVSGRPADVALELLEQESFDGIVVGSRGRGLLARSLLGSTSSAVLHHAQNTPVVVARQDTAANILVGVDDAPSSLRAVRLAARIARAHGAKLVLLHALEFPSETFSQSRQKVEQSLRAAGQALLDKARAEIGELAATAETVFVDPGQGLVAAAERQGADLVVVGRQGGRPSRWTRLGSVSHKVAMNASASVLVVP